jgi:hypothetical protein
MAPVCSLKQTQKTSIDPTVELHFHDMKLEKSLFVSNSRIEQVSAFT